MGFTIEQLSEKTETQWQQIAREGLSGTLFHNLSFLSYHGDRFRDNEHNLLFVKGDTPFGILPLGLFKSESGLFAKSPYGASYGGPVFMKKLKYQELRDTVSVLVEYLVARNVDQIMIRLPFSAIIHNHDEMLRFVLLEQGFECVERDICNIVPVGRDIDIKTQLDSRVRNKIKQAKKLDITIEKNGDLDDFNLVFEKTFERLGIKPTHTVHELSLLHELLPNQIYFDIAYLEDKPVAGICNFVLNQNVNSSFYLCHDPEYRNTHALSYLITERLSVSQIEGYKWYDFGSSSRNNTAEPQLLSFKENFGSVGQLRETYRWEKK